MAAMNLVHANVVYDVLVEWCGAREDKREDFTHYMTRDVDMGHEFRFMGDLGFGGKLYWDGRCPPRVGCYREDDSAERSAAIEKTNHRLKALFS